MFKRLAKLAQSAFGSFSRSFAPCLLAIVVDIITRNSLVATTSTAWPFFRKIEWIVNAQSHEPPQQQIAIHLLHRLPRGPDREKIWRKRARITRSGAMARAAKVGVEHIEIGIQARACIVHDPPDLAKWMVRRNSLFKVKIAEQRTARFVRPTQRHPHRRCRNKGESCSGRRVEAGLF